MLSPGFGGDRLAGLVRSDGGSFYLSGCDFEVLRQISQLVVGLGAGVFVKLYSLPQSLNVWEQIKLHKNIVKVFTSTMP